VPQVHALVGLHFGSEAPVDYPGAQRTDTARYAAFFHAMLQRGVAMAPGAYEVMFPGLAHTDDVIDAIGAAARDAAASLDA
jgi:glutamate-1-semialdehyde 2,1-aminomutase